MSEDSGRTRNRRPLTVKTWHISRASLLGTVLNDVDSVLTPDVMFEISVLDPVNDWKYGGGCGNICSIIDIMLDSLLLRVGTDGRKAAAAALGTN